MSLLKSGIVPIGRGFPSKKASRSLEEVDPREVNLHLLPTAQSSNDNYGAHCASRPEKQGTASCDNHVIRGLVEGGCARLLIGCF